MQHPPAAFLTPPQGKDLAPTRLNQSKAKKQLKNAEGSALKRIKDDQHWTR